MARLSLTFIAALFFLKSFASGYGVAWYNPNVAAGLVCTDEDVALVDNAVEQMLFEKAGYPTDDWLTLESDADRNLRGRELCSQSCIDRCRNCYCMCYGICSGCRRRSTFTVDRELYTTEELEGYCSETVRSAATQVSPSCAAAVQDALCEVAL
jgi:hypothetical protein